MPLERFSLPLILFPWLSNTFAGATVSFATPFVVSLSVSVGLLIPGMVVGARGRRTSPVYDEACLTDGCSGTYGASLSVNANGWTQPCHGEAGVLLSAFACRFWNRTRASHKDQSVNPVAA